MIRIVTDSTADFTVEQAKALGITIVPLTVSFGDESYLDNIELDNARFYEKLQESKELPRTSQPAPAKFQEAYLKLIEEGADGILSVHLSSKLSGTYQSACTARDTLPDEAKKIPIEIVDSQSVSVGMSYAIRKAAAEAQEGASMADIKSHLVDCLERTHILAVLDTLEFVKRGGRIGAAKALLGNMLSVKPIISLKDGEVVPIEQPRTRTKAFARIAQLLEEMKPLENVSIAEASEEIGEQLAAVLKAAYPAEIERTKLGGVLGAHTGPGTAAISIVVAR